MSQLSCKNDPIFAAQCKFDNPHLCKPNGKSVLGITMLSNSTVLKYTNLRASRHADLKTHALYQRPTDENIEKK